MIPAKKGMFAKMAGIDRIKDKILSDAKEKAKAILEAAKSEAESIIAKAEQEALARAEKAEQSAQDEARNLKKRMLAIASLEERKRMLKIRQDLMDQAFEGALEKIVGLPDKEYGDLLMSFIMDSVRVGECDILFNESDRQRLGERYVSMINDALKKSGKESNLKLSEETIRSRGGFILRYNDMEINGTLEIILGQLRPKIEAEVASYLFRD